MTKLHAVVDFVAYALAIYAIVHKVQCHRRWKAVAAQIDETVRLARLFKLTKEG